MMNDNNNDGAEAYAQRRLHQQRAQKACLFCLVLFFCFAILSGDLFFILISFFLLVSLSSGMQQQAREEEEERAQAAVRGGTVRVVPTDPRMAGLHGPVAGTPDVTAPNYMVIQFGNGQVYHVPLAGAGMAQAGPSLPSQAVDITDPLTGQTVRTTATAAIPILVNDTTTTAPPHGSASPTRADANTATTWMEDCEAAKQREGAEEEADALYGSGVAYEARDGPEGTATGDVTCVEVHDSPTSDNTDEPQKPHAKKDEEL